MASWASLIGQVGEKLLKDVVPEGAPQDQRLSEATFLQKGKGCT